MQNILAHFPQNNYTLVPFPPVSPKYLWNFKCIFLKTILGCYKSLFLCLLTCLDLTAYFYMTLFTELLYIIIVNIRLHHDVACFHSYMCTYVQLSCSRLMQVLSMRPWSFFAIIFGCMWLLAFFFLFSFFFCLCAYTAIKLS